MTLTQRAPASQQVTWERFDPERLGYDVLAGWLAAFYGGAPWNEYKKCFSCSSAEDFTFVGTYSAEQLDGGDPVCPACGATLDDFWTADRVRAFFRVMGEKGRVTGFTVRVAGEPAGCVWGYEIGPSVPVAWEPRPEGRGTYIDRILVVPEQRNGIALSYLLMITFRELRRDQSYLVTRTHVRASMVRTLLKRLGFVEQNECPILPERSYWVRSLAIAGGLPAEVSR
jgi:hypothetical protein